LWHNTLFFRPLNSSLNINQQTLGNGDFTFLYTCTTQADSEMVSYRLQANLLQPQRTKDMNKLIITTISALMLSASGMALAQNSDGESGDRGKRQHREPQANPLVEQVMRGIKRLDLEEDQKTSIRAIMKTLKADSRVLMGQTRDNQQQLKALITADSYDEAAVFNVAENEGKLATERMLLSASALSDIYTQLTEEQRAELSVMTQERMAKRGERRKDRSPEG
jgi:protein CpxP